MMLHPRQKDTSIFVDQKQHYEIKYNQAAIFVNIVFTYQVELLYANQKNGAGLHL